MLDLMDNIWECVQKCASYVLFVSWDDCFAFNQRFALSIFTPNRTVAGCLVTSWLAFNPAHRYGFTHNGGSGKSYT